MADKYIISKAKLTAIADAIRTKTGGTANLTADQMATAITGIKSYDDALDSVIDGSFFNARGTITTSAEKIKAYALANVDAIRYFYAPYATTCGNNAFYCCYHLKTIEIGTEATTNITLSNNIGDGLSSISNIVIGSESVSSVDIGYDSLKYLQNKAKITIYNISSLYKTSFGNCDVLFMSFYNDALPTLNGGKYDYMMYNVTYYVPDDKADALKADTNWSAYANQIKKMSEYTGG